MQPVFVADVRITVRVLGVRMENSEQPTKQEQSGSLTLGNLVANLNKVTSIKIVDEWSGYNPLAPFIARYNIVVGKDRVTINAVHSVGPENYVPLQESFEISYGPEILTDFLEQVAETSLEEGKYEAAWFYTDSYPSIEVKLKVGNRQLKLFTSSQGEYNLPWGATYNKKEYVISSPSLAQAYETLLGYSDHSRLQILIEHAEKTGWQPQPNSTNLLKWHEDPLTNE